MDNKHENKAKTQSKWVGTVKNFAEKEWQKHGDQVLSKATEKISERFGVDGEILDSIKDQVLKKGESSEGTIETSAKDTAVNSPKRVDSTTEVVKQKTVSGRKLDLDAVADKGGKVVGRFAKTAINQILPGRSIKLGFWLLIIILALIVVLLFVLAIK